MLGDGAQTTAIDVHAASTWKFPSVSVRTHAADDDSPPVQACDADVPLTRAAGGDPRVMRDIRPSAEHATVVRSGVQDWRTVDRALRAIRQRRSGLDAEEARWLREAEALQIWRPLGMVSALDYLERVLGYGPRTAQDRLRVARALGDLPGLTAALSADQLSYSAVRELTRVATPATEAFWIAAAIGKNLRQIEDLVADRRPGDRPEDPPDPAARTHVVRFELSAATFALLRQARLVLDDEHGTNLADDAFVVALCSAVLDDAPVTEATGRAKFQIAVTVCERCRQGWQQGAGARIAIDATAVDRALCDAQHVGSIDGATPERAHQDIPPSVVRFVWRRDGGRCRVDGCRSSRGIEIHHITHRADGGNHDPSNLILACGSCHQAHHAGRLTIAGTADRLEFRRGGASAAPIAMTTTTSADMVVVVAAAADADAHGSAVENRTNGVAQDDSMSAVEVAMAPVVSADAHAHGGAEESASLPHDGLRSALNVALSSAAAPGALRHGNAENRSVAANDCPVSAIEVATPRLTVVNARAHGGADQANLIAKVGPGAASSGAEPDAHVDACARSAGVARAEIAHAGRCSSLAVGGDEHASAASRLEATILRAQAKDALTGLGWKPAIAHAAVAASIAEHGSEVTLERLIVESLRRCPVRRA